MRAGTIQTAAMRRKSFGRSTVRSDAPCYCKRMGYSGIEGSSKVAVQMLLQQVYQQMWCLKRWCQNMVLSHVSAITYARVWYITELVWGTRNAPEQF